MKKMLINATHQEEHRIAIVDGQYLTDLDIESAEGNQQKSNIYKASIDAIQANISAAFVNYGSDKNGFLPLKDLFRTHGKESAKKNYEIIVQVEKDARGSKGAALTTQISLPGRFLVLMPNTVDGSGISRKISSQERDRLKALVDNLEIPDEMSVIVRTAAYGKSQQELKWDLNYLIKLWNLITKANSKAAPPSLLYKDSNVILRALRDYTNEDISEILIDSSNAYKEALEFAKQVMPNHLNKIKLYSDTIHLFSRYHIEHQIESAYKREIKLKSGGEIVIDHTEALTSVDVNSARSQRGDSIEELAISTNMEAAEELTRQLRIRDMGGLVVIDFIDMNSYENRKKLENHVRQLIKIDRARVQISQISEFGLMEMSRQRIRPSLIESSQIVCPRCNGQGTVRDIESLALSILRLIGEESIKDGTVQVRAMVPVDISAFLLNEKREMLSEIESSSNTKVIIIPNPNMTTPDFDVQRIKDEDNNAESYRLIPKAQELSATKVLPKKTLNQNTPVTAQVRRKRVPKRNIFKKIWAVLCGKEYWNEDKNKTHKIYR